MTLSILCAWLGSLNCPYTRADSPMATSGWEGHSILVSCRVLGYPVYCRTSPRGLPAAMGAVILGVSVQ